MAVTAHVKADAFKNEWCASEQGSSRRFQGRGTQYYNSYERLNVCDLVRESPKI